MFLLSSLSNMIIDQRVVGSVVDGSVGKWSVGGWLVVHGFNKTQEKHVCGSDFLCALWSRFILLV